MSGSFSATGRGTTRMCLWSREVLLMADHSERAAGLKQRVVELRDFL
jgi:hypothetical protein